VREAQHCTGGEARAVVTIINGDGSDPHCHWMMLWLRVGVGIVIDGDCVVNIYEIYVHRIQQKLS